MCIFSQAIELVAATKIFARGLSDGRQVLIYAMDVAANGPLAMVLPLPVPPQGPDDAIEFVDLSGYRDVMDDLAKAFPDLRIAPQSLGRSRAAVANTLAVHRVGDFDASYVPSPRDFERLDPRFRIPAGVIEAQPQYADYGFAVFQLRVEAHERSTIHPMALRFPRRDPAELFFPTVHVHDGRLPDRAEFDHELYAQHDPIVARLCGWNWSRGPLGDYIDAKADQLFDRDLGGHALGIRGSRPNRDVVLRPPAVALEDLDVRAECHAYAIRATYGFRLESHHKYPRWRDTMSTRLPALCAGMRGGLDEWVAAKRSTWRLAPLSPELPPYFMNGSQLWAGTDYMHGRHAPSPTGPGHLVLRPFTELVEPQNVMLGFAEMPSQDDAHAIERELRALLDRAVA